MQTIAKKEKNIKINNKNWRIGFDPEFFLFDNKTKKIVNAIPILKKDKYNPHKLADGIKVYADNVLLETTTPISSSKGEMLKNLKKVFTSIQSKVLKHDYRIISKAAHKFEKSQLNDDKSWEIGCTPSFNVWDKSVTPSSEYVDTTRTSAGHIHVSHPKLADFDTREIAIKILDIILGNSLVILGQDDSSAVRRTLYGKSGEFRFEHDRAEYRVPDSYYLRSPITTELVYDIIDYSLNLVFNGNGNVEKIIALFSPDEIRNAINNCDKEQSLNILNKINLPKDLFERININYGELDLYKEWNIEV